jgi:hypothetical protein
VVRDDFIMRDEALLGHGLAQNPQPPPPPGGPEGKRRQGRRKQSPVRNLLHRLWTYEHEALRFLDDFAVPCDNNQAERDLRMVKVQQKVSGTFCSDAGADAFCRIRSVCRSRPESLLCSRRLPRPWGKPVGQARGASPWGKPVGQARGASPWGKPVGRAPASAGCSGSGAISTGASPMPFGVGALLYKFRATLTTHERQQTKWVLLGLIVSVGFSLCLLLLVVALPNLLSNGALRYFYFAAIPLETVVLLSAPISFAIAIFRYNLWDIDLLINRALVYGSLTGILAVIYFGLVISAQSAFQSFTGQQGQQPLIVVASTLLIAGLFQPLRSRLQKIIDRRFYRSKYDAQKTLSAFGTTLRQEVDLAELRQRLVKVVEETMQPSHVSLWLRSPESPTQPLIDEELRDTV